MACTRRAPRWHSKTEAALRALRRGGLNGFREDQSVARTSFADNVFTNVRAVLDTRRGRPIKFLLERVWPFRVVFESQVALTRGYARDELALLAARMSESPIALDLVSRYRIRNSLLGGCVAAGRIGDEWYSMHHLRMLQLIDRICRHVGARGSGALRTARRPGLGTYRIR